MLHYNPRHVSSSNVCRMRADSAESALMRHTVQPFTESDDTRCCDNTVCPPEDGHVRNAVVECAPTRVPREIMQKMLSFV
jgi:hypothetical protein